MRIRPHDIVAITFSLENSVPRWPKDGSERPPLLRFAKRRGKLAWRAFSGVQVAAAEASEAYSKMLVTGIE